MDLRDWVDARTSSEQGAPYTQRAQLVQRSSPLEWLSRRFYRREERNLPKRNIRRRGSFDEGLGRIVTGLAILLGIYESVEDITYKVSLVRAAEPGEGPPWVGLAHSGTGTSLTLSWSAEWGSGKVLIQITSQFSVERATREHVIVGAKIHIIPGWAFRTGGHPTASSIPDEQVDGRVILSESTSWGTEAVAECSRDLRFLAARLVWAGDDELASNVHMELHSSSAGSGSIRGRRTQRARPRKGDDSDQVVANDGSDEKLPPARSMRKAHYERLVSKVNTSANEWFMFDLLFDRACDDHSAGALTHKILQIRSRKGDVRAGDSKIGAKGCIVCNIEARDCDRAVIYSETVCEPVQVNKPGVW